MNGVAESMTEAVRPPLPEFVQIGPFRYTIHVGGDGWTRARLEELHPQLTGHASHVRLEIAITDGLAHDAFCEVLIHEILHGCYNVAGQPLDSMSSNDHDENAVRTLAPSLLMVLRDNPDLVAFLVA